MLPIILALATGGGEVSKCITQFIHPSSLLETGSHTAQDGLILTYVAEVNLRTPDLPASTYEVLELQACNTYLLGTQNPSLIYSIY